jgi:hypothetical protein
MANVFNFSKFSQLTDSVPARETITEDPASGSSANPSFLMDQAPDTSGFPADEMESAISVPVFNNGCELFNKLKEYSQGKKDPGEAYSEVWNNYFAKFVSGSEGSSAFEDGLKRFYEQPYDSNEANKIAMDLFEIYKNMAGTTTQPIMAEQKAASDIDSIVKLSDDAISAMARTAAKARSSKSYNMAKIAQHKSMVDSVIMTGPNQVSISPFTRDLQSSMHLVEQNKGFGLRVGDILDIDFEAIWRSSVMDKYYRSTRDSSGMYGGGYIDDKFEVNRYIPEGNNYQLPPGIRNRPYIPESGLLEARMEVARGQKDRLSDPRKFAKVYNHSFSNKKKV